MNLTLKLTVVFISMLLWVNSIVAQGCNLPIQYVSKDLTRSEQLLMTFYSDTDRLLFDIEAFRYTKSTASLSIYANGTLVKGVAIKKGRFDTYFALNNLQGKVIHIKGKRGSHTDKRNVKIYVKKFVTILNREREVATEQEYITSIPRSGSRAFSTFEACNGMARLNISVTNSNNSNMIVRVREFGSGGPLINTFTLSGATNTRNFIRYIDSDERLHIEITNTNPNMRKDIRASVRYTNSIPPNLSNQ